MILDRSVDYDVELGNTTVPTYDTVEIAFKHIHDNSKTLPFMASSIIDINNDGVEEVFLGGGIGQEDHLYEFKNGNFIELNNALPKKTNVETTYGSIAFDTDYDGDVDLLIARESGVCLLYTSPSPRDQRGSRMPSSA